MNWISDHPEFVGVAIVVVLLTMGASKIVPGAKSNKGLMWLAFGVYAVCGLILGYALQAPVTWLVGGRPGAGGAWISILAVLVVVLGWTAMSMVVAMIRDLADGRPDDEARRAALWVPTLLPAGWQAVWGIVTQPHGAVTGVVAAIIAGVTIVYAHKIVADALKGKAGRKAWNWFAALVCLLAGLVTLPLVLYLDGVLGDRLSADTMFVVRLLAGVVGVAFLIAAAADMKDRVPDKYVRNFLSYGLPLLLVFGGAAIASMAGYAGNGGDILTGSLQ